jgi:DNA repair protein RecN (Recombination protein N)
MDITNFALIDNAVFEPRKGFTIITGETGAGKSLLIDALDCLRGSRAGKDTVRTGCRKAVIEALFDGVSGLVEDRELEEYGIAPEADDTMIITREITSDGKSAARINGKMVPLSVLKEFGSRLVDIHGQNDQQAIFQPAMHIELLDRFGGAAVTDKVAEYATALQEYRSCIEEIRKLGTDPAARKRRAELLSYQISELEEAGFRKGEEEELLQQKKLLSSGERLREGLSECCALLKSEEEGSVPMQLAAAEALLESVVKLEPALKETLDQLSQAISAIEGTGDVLEAYLDRAGLPQASLSDIESRLDQLFRFKVKYGSTIPEMLLFLENARAEADDLKGSEKRLEQLHRDRLVLEKVLMEKADAVHNARKTAARDLSRSIIAELSDLGMDGAVFSVAFSQRPRDRFFTRNGYDDVAFMMSANPGEPEKPLAKIASGGEASRIMLAIKTILASADSTPTLIFDEIDAGISGRTATIVAQKLRRLSETHQVFCVTHMAQISAAADRHYIIEKETRDERTHTMIRSLEKKEREEEVARLLSGDRYDKTSLDLAARLIAGRSGEFLASDLEEKD